MSILPPLIDISPPNPVIRLGSRGDAVQLLQSLLNFIKSLPVPELQEDGIFGPLTHRATMAFQALKNLAADGIVGVLTWTQLQTVVGPQKTKAQTEAELGAKIVDFARLAVARHSVKTPVLDEDHAHLSIEIAAGSGFGTFDGRWPGNRHDFSKVHNRRGGMALQNIFRLGGASSGLQKLCPCITDKSVVWWQTLNRTELNKYDLPAWCGIFAYYVYRSVGVDLANGWVDRSSNIYTTKKLRVFTKPENAFEGCIGVIDGRIPNGKNHHFIVEERVGGTIFSFDGNVHDRKLGQVSTIGARDYKIADLKTEQVYFLAPNLK